jgi:hypothetical protein
MRRAFVLALLATLGCERATAASAPPDASTAAPALPSASASAAPNAPSKATASALPAPDPEPAAPKPIDLLKKPPATWAVRDAAWKGPIDRGKDAPWLERLSSAPIVEITKNRGGATITLRVRFADGARAVLKPEQTHSASNHRSEIVAFHLDRVLGLGRTAPVAGRTLDAARVRAWLAHGKAEPEWLARFDREVVVRDGKLAGALIAWHERRLTKAEPPRGWQRSLFGADAATLPSERVLEWSDMVGFDYLLDNADRWSGGNVLALGDGGPLIFLDNAAGLMRGAWPEPEKSPLGPLCRFRKSTIETLRAATPTLGARLRRSLAKEPLAPVISDRQLEAIDARLEKLIEHVDRCIAEHGRERVLGE